MRSSFVYIIVSLLFSLNTAWAGAPLYKLITFSEFSEVAIAMSKKVNLFQEIWKKNQAAELYGGTSRDFLNYVKGQFKDVGTREEALKKIDDLKMLTNIDVRDFIIGESDVDVVSDVDLKIVASQFGMKKIDTIKSDRFDPKTSTGKTELDQGGVPVEKILINMNRLHAQVGYESGVQEIYKGVLSVKIPDLKIFRSTHYAQLGTNHPVLLVTRFLRDVAINYFQEHGREYPDEKLLNEMMDADSVKSIEMLLQNSESLNDLDQAVLKREFVEKFNQTVQKAFRSYTNPTATYVLVKRFGFDNLLLRYGDKIEPINQYLFSKHRDEKQISENLKKLNLDPEKIYLKASDELEGSVLYHGTRNDKTFRSILLQGVFESTYDRMVGAGLYGVSIQNLSVARDYADQDEKNIVKFKISDQAKIVDIESPEGSKAFDEYKKATGQKDFEKFADYLGIDIIKYRLSGTPAFAVKNSSVLGKPEGYKRTVFTSSQLFQFAKKVKTVADFEMFIDNIGIGAFTDSEIVTALKFIDLDKNEMPVIFTNSLKILEDTTVSATVRSRAVVFVMNLVKHHAALKDQRFNKKDLKRLDEKLLKEIFSFQSSLYQATAENPKAVRVFLSKFSNVLVSGEAVADRATMKILSRNRRVLYSATSKIALTYFRYPVTAIFATIFGCLYSSAHSNAKVEPISEDTKKILLLVGAGFFTATIIADIKSVKVYEWADEFFADSRNRSKFYKDFKNACSVYMKGKKS